MVLIHLETRAGEVLVRLPDGSTRWVAVGELIALANSDKPKAAKVIEAVVDAAVKVVAPKAGRTKK